MGPEVLWDRFPKGIVRERAGVEDRHALRYERGIHRPTWLGRETTGVLGPYSSKS